MTRRIIHWWFQCWRRVGESRVWGGLSHVVSVSDLAKIVLCVVHNCAWLPFLAVHNLFVDFLLQFYNFMMETKTRS